MKYFGNWKELDFFNLESNLFCVKIEREETQEKQKFRKIEKCVAGLVVLLTKMLCLLHAPP